MERWERGSEWPLAVVAVLFLVAYAWPILDNHLQSPWRDICHVFDYGAWVIFVIDYVIRLSLARHRMYYWSRHLPDLAVIALPILRPLRLLRLIMLLKVLNRRATDSLRGKVLIYVSGAAVLVIFCASLAVLDAERGHAGANITTFGDALWWSVSTIMTVGYGDRYPVTSEGRGVAIGLMIGGIAIIGVVTASFATWLIDKVREVEVESQQDNQLDTAAILAKLDQLNLEVVALRAEIRGLTAASGKPDGL